jgi:hypothetical protein
MSRRISIWTLAAVTVLFVAPAKADRECFENSCRLPDVTAAPAKAESATQPEQHVTPASGAARAAAPAAAQAPAAAPTVIHSRVVVAPAPAQPTQPAATVDADEALAQHQSTPLPPRDPSPMPAATAVVKTLPVAAYARVHQAPPPAPEFIASKPPARGGVVVVGIPGAIYPDVGVVPAYPYYRQDPAWELCQGEHGVRGRRTYDCGPYSYHPYGEYGYRPNGTYDAASSAPAYMVAPSAKIISIDSND